jgi:hypothetical protein
VGSWWEGVAFGGAFTRAGDVGHSFFLFLDLWVYEVGRWMLCEMFL